MKSIINFSEWHKATIFWKAQAKLQLLTTEAMMFFVEVLK